MSPQDRARAWAAIASVSIVAAGLEWDEPFFVTSTPQGEGVLEWFSADTATKERKITVYVNPDESVEYIRSWGACMVTEMDDGDLASPAEIVPLWRWLCGVDGCGGGRCG